MEAREEGVRLGSRPHLSAADRTFTPAEIRFEAWRRTTGLFLGPVVLVFVWLAPLPLDTDAHRLAAIMAFVVVWWVTEAVPIPVTALVGTALTVVSGVATAAAAFAPFASPVVFLFIGSFMIGRAVAVHRLDLRLAHGLLASRLVGGRTARVPIALGLLTVVVSGWISGTATTAMMAPLALGVLGALRAQLVDTGRRFGSRLLLTIAFAASVGSNLTPVGAPSNLVALGFLDRTVGVRIDFFTWMTIGAPLTVAMAAALLLVTTWLLPDTPENDAQPGAGAWEPPAPGPWTPGQRNALLVFCLAAALWIAPGLMALAAPGSPFTALLAERLDIATVAVLAAGLLFVLPTSWSERRFTLDWQEARQIDWGTILLFGGGLSLGQLMFATGLAEVLGRGLILLSGAETLWTVTAMSVAAAILLSQFTSNTATAALLTPVVLSITVAAGLNPVPPALGVAFACGVPFLLPISSPPNAIVYGTGLVPVTAMMKVGMLLNVIGFVLIVLVLRVLCPPLGLA